MEYFIIFTFIIFLSSMANVANKTIINAEHQTIRLDHLIREKKLKNIVLFLMFFILLLFAGLRYNVGIDYIVYSNNQIPKVLEGNPNTVEFLYEYLILFGNSLGNRQWIFFFTHLLILAPVFQSINKLSHDIFWSTYILLMGGFFNHSLNIMRQSIAISIFIFSIKYIFDKKLKRYCLLIFIAFLFHKTAIIYFPIYFLYNINFSIKKTFLFLFTSLVSSSMVFQILTFVSVNFGVYNNYINRYFKSDPFSGSYFLINFIILLLILYIYKVHNGSLDKQLSFYANIQVITIGIFAFYEFIPNYDRVMYMFYPVQILLVPKLLSEINNTFVRKSIETLLILVYFFVFYRIYIQKNIGATFPYDSVLGT